MNHSVRRFSPDNTQIKLVKIRRGFLNSSLSRYGTLFSKDSLLKQPNDKQVKFNFRTVRLQKKGEELSSSGPWHDQEKPIPQYRLVVRERPPYQDKNICMYFETKQQAQSCQYQIFAAGIMNQKDIIKSPETDIKTNIKDCYLEAAKQLKESIAHTIIDHFQVKIKENIQIHKLQQQKPRKQQFLKQLIQRFMQQSDSKDSVIRNFLEHWNQKHLNCEPISDSHQQEKAQFNKSNKSKQQKDVINLCIKEIKLLKKPYPSNLLLKINIGAQQKSTRIVLVSESKEHNHYRLSTQILIQKTASQITKNPYIQFAIQQLNSRKTVCSASINCNQFKNTQFGHFLVVPLLSIQPLDYKKSYTKELEDSHATTSYPYTIQLEVFPDIEGIDSLQKLRNQNLHHNFMSIPNLARVIFNLAPWSQSKVLAYEKYLNIPQQPLELLSQDRVLKLQQRLIRQFQKQQSKSYASELVGSSYSILNSHLSQNHQKWYQSNCQKLSERGILKTKRLQTYEAMLQVSNSAIKSYNSLEKDVIDPTKQSFQQDYKHWNIKKPREICQKVREILLEYICFRRSRNDYLYDCSLLPLAERILNLVMLTNSLNGLEQTESKTKQRSFRLFIFFIQKVTPYFKNSQYVLLKDIQTIRRYLQQYLPTFNQHLKNSFQTLNDISSKMLCMWSTQHPQLTYRIWDLLVCSSINKETQNNVFVCIAISYMKHWEKHGDMQVVNINRFIADVKALGTLKASPIYNLNQDQNQKMKKNLASLAHQSNIYQLLSKIELDVPQQCTSPTLSSNIEPTQHRFHKQFPFLISLMIKQVKIHANIGVSNYKLVLIHYCTPKTQFTIYEGLDKLVFLNYYLDLKDSSTIEIRAISKIVKLTSGKIDLGVGTSGYLEKKHIKLTPITGTDSYISESNIQVIVVRKPAKPILEFPKILNKYSSERNPPSKTKSHPGIQYMGTLCEIFKSMKQPLDQFQQTCKNIDVKCFKRHNPQWIQNSQISIPQFNIILKSLILKDKDQISNSQKNYLYSQFQYLDKINLGKFIFSLIIYSQSSIKTKINLFYLLFQKHQSLHQSSLTCSSFESLFLQIQSFYGFTEHLYLPKLSIQKSFLHFSSKHIQSRQITQIIRHWAYQCFCNYGSLDIILGTADKLLLLRSLLPQNDVIMIQKQRGCGIEIVYENEVGVYSWNVAIDGQFFILKRGQKKDDIYPDYLKQNANHAKADFLHNYQNVIPLSPNENISRQKFEQMIMSNPVMKYLLVSRVKQNYRSTREILQVHVFVDGKNQLQMQLNDKKMNLSQISETIYNDYFQGKQFFLSTFIGDNMLFEDKSITITQLQSILSKNKHIQLHYFTQRAEEEELQMLPTESDNEQNIEHEFVIGQLIDTKELMKSKYQSLGLSRYENVLSTWRPCFVLSENETSYQVVFQNGLNNNYHSQDKVVLPKHHVVRLCQK